MLLLQSEIEKIKTKQNKTKHKITLYKKCITVVTTNFDNQNFLFYLLKNIFI